MLAKSALMLDFFSLVKLLLLFSVHVHAVESNQPQRDLTHRQNGSVVGVSEWVSGSKVARFEYNKMRA